MEINISSNVWKHRDGRTRGEFWDFEIARNKYNFYEFENKKGNALIVSPEGNPPHILSIYPNEDFIRIDNDGKIKYRLTIDGITLKNDSLSEGAEVIYSNGDKAIGEIYIDWLPIPKKIKEWMENGFPSNIAKNKILFQNGNYYYADGRHTKVINGKTEEQLIAERKASDAKAKAELKKQQAARAENEKNTKATQAFLNSVWGKRFTFNGYGDQYGNYNHGSSVLTFSSNHSDIWLDIAGTTQHFKIDHINGKEIWVKDIFAYVSSITIIPIKRNGKQAFKVSFYSLDTTYILY